MSSGVTVQQDCISVYNDVKLRHQFRFLIYSMTDDLKQIRILSKAPPDATYDQFVEELKEAEALKQCRYAVFDADFELADGQKRSKLVFFLWSPESATVKQKMLYTSSKNAIRKSLVGIGKEVQACDYGDLAWSNVLEVLLK